MQTFDKVQECFQEFDFVKGLSILQNFITNELSGIYLELCKDSLYCDKVGSKRREASVSVMAIITREMLYAIAPILTYTANEALGYASEAITEGAIKEVFSLKRSPYRYEVNEDFTELLEIKNAFESTLNALKQEGKIKSSLELVIAGEYEFEALDVWLIVSESLRESSSEKVAEFSVNGKVFSLHKASKAKCPRCWRYLSVDENTPCERCAEVLRG